MVTVDCRLKLNLLTKFFQVHIPYGGFMEAPHNPTFAGVIIGRDPDLGVFFYQEWELAFNFRFGYFDKTHAYKD